MVDFLSKRSTAFSASSMCLAFVRVPFAVGLPLGVPYPGATAAPHNSTGAARKAAANVRTAAAPSSSVASVEVAGSALARVFQFEIACCSLKRSRARSWINWGQLGSIGVNWG
eukprot:SAG31_NODE_1897_length_6964_cov_2.677349_3_plen_113_part_00